MYGCVHRSVKKFCRDSPPTAPRAPRMPCTPPPPGHRLLEPGSTVPKPCYTQTVTMFWYNNNLWPRKRLGRSFNLSIIPVRLDGGKRMPPSASPPKIVGMPLWACPCVVATSGVVVRGHSQPRRLHPDNPIYQPPHARRHRRLARTSPTRRALVGTASRHKRLFFASVCGQTLEAVQLSPRRRRPLLAGCLRRPSRRLQRPGLECADRPRRHGHEPTPCPGQQLLQRGGAVRKLQRP